MAQIDYWITAVHYLNNEHISTVKIGQNVNGLTGPEYIWRRGEVVNSIDHGTIIYTKTAFGEKAPVEKYLVNGTYYIKTKPDNTPRDNLDHLPRF